MEFSIERRKNQWLIFSPDGMNCVTDKRTETAARGWREGAERKEREWMEAERDWKKKERELKRDQDEADKEQRRKERSYGGRERAEEEREGTEKAAGGSRERTKEQRQRMYVLQYNSWTLSSFAEGPHHWITRWTAREKWAKEVKCSSFTRSNWLFESRICCISVNLFTSCITELERRLVTKRAQQPAGLRICTSASCWETGHFGERCKVFSKPLWVLPCSTSTKLGSILYVAGLSNCLYIVFW
jgi:hypothetical protein